MPSSIVRSSVFSILLLLVVFVLDVNCVVETAVDNIMPDAVDPVDEVVTVNVAADANNADVEDNGEEEDDDDDKDNEDGKAFNAFVSK